MAESAPTEARRPVPDIPQSAGPAWREQDRADRRGDARYSAKLLRARSGTRLLRDLIGQTASPAARSARRHHAEFYHGIWSAAARDLGLQAVSTAAGDLEILVGSECLRIRGTHCSIDGQEVLDLAGDKARVYRMLSRAGLPVPAHRAFSLCTLDAAQQFIREAPGLCVVKPALNAAMGRGVTTGVLGRKDLERAAIAATAAGAQVLQHDPALSGLVDAFRREVPLLVEQQVPGANYRLLFLDGRLIDAIRRDPPSVAGDGRRTVAELIKMHNRGRLERGGAFAQRLVSYDLELEQNLAAQGLELSSVPAAGRTVLLKTAINETSLDANQPARELLCNAVIEDAARAAAIVGARLAGVDVITTNPGRSLSDAGGCILEVNTTPGLAMHHHGHAGSIDPASIILDHLAQSARLRGADAPSSGRGPWQEQPPVILLGGAMNALSIARCLGELGVRVYAIGVPSFVQRSRFVRPIRTKAADDAATSWAASLLGPETDHLRGAVVLAASDIGLEVVARHRDALSERFLLDECDVDAQLAMLDKLATYELATEAGVPTPRFWRVDDERDLARCRDDLVFPLIVKPLLSHEYQRKFPGLTKFRVAHDMDGLLAEHRELTDAGIGVLLVEQIPGPDDLLCSYYTYLDSSGSPTFHFTKRAPRRYPPGMGLACYHVTDWNPEVRDVALRLFKHAGLRGVANAEFKRDVRDGQLKLIECNARFTAANCLVAAAGLDLAKYVYLRVLGHDPQLPPTYRTGLRLIHHMVDLRAFLILRNHGELGLLRWLGSLLHAQTLSVARWDDPLPALVRSEVWEWACARRARLVARRQR